MTRQLPDPKAPDRKLPDRAPTLEDIERLAGEAFESIPAELRRHVANVVFRVEEFPDEQTERDMELEIPSTSSAFIAVLRCPTAASIRCGAPRT